MYFHNPVITFFKDVPFAVQNSLVFKNGPLENVGRVQFARINSIRAVNSLIVEVELNSGERWMQPVDYMNKPKTLEHLHPLPHLFATSFPAISSDPSLRFWKLLWFCNSHYLDTWPISVSKPNKSVSSQRISSNPFEVQTLCSLNRRRYCDKLLVSATIRLRELLAFTLQDSQEVPQKVGTEKCST